MHFHDKRTVEWGHWGLTFMEPQPDASRNYGKIIGTVPFPVGNCGPCDGTVGSPQREKYRAMCKAWMERGELPPEFIPNGQEG